ncbi:MAG TPA: AI-2E family transporter [Anaerolineales bacterium]|nr:AI-2E family transporter [Anaerolineales bacterium]
MKTTWSKPTKYLVAIGFVLLGIFILYLSRSVIPPLVVAGLIAVIVRPVISWLQLRVHLSRGPAVGLVYLCLAILGPLVVILILPTIIEALVYVGSLDYRGLLEGSAEWLRSTLTTIKAARLPVAALDAYVDRAIDTVLAAFQTSSPTVVPPSLDAILQPLSSALKSLMESSANLVGTVFSRAAAIVFTFLASIYMSLDADTHRGALLQAVPAAYQPEISILLARIERMWGAFFQGELRLMLVIGVITTIGLTALGMPGALYLGTIAGLLELIPTIGPIIAAVPAVIVALVQGSAYLPIGNLAFAGLILLFYILVQQVENNLIVPRVLGDAVELPPLVVMTGAVVGASVGGILGVMLATPIIASGREILGYLYSKLLDQEPFPIEETLPESGTSSSLSRDWLSSRLAEFKKRIGSRSPESREDNEKASHPQSTSRQ